MAKGDFLQVPDEVYQRVFQQDADGQMILDELAREFYDVPCFGGTGGRTAEQAIHIDGSRRVIMYIMSRCGLLTSGGQ